MSLPSLRSFQFKRWSILSSNKRESQSSSSKTEYHSVPLLDEETSTTDTNGSQDGDDAKYQLRAARKILPRYSHLAYVSIFLFLALISLSIAHVHLLYKISPLGPRDCGKSIEEARERGCTFDNLAKTWLPEVCPRFGMTEFSEAGMDFTDGSKPFRYYLDREGMQELTPDELGELANIEFKDATKWWTTGREHIYHCTWMLMRSAHVLDAGGRKDSLVGNFHHAKHCMMFLMEAALDGDRVDEIRVKGVSKFGGC